MSAKARQDEAEVRRIEHKLAVNKEISNLMGNGISDFAEASRMAEELVSSEERQKDAERQIADAKKDQTGELKSQREILRDIDAQLSALESNPFLSREQKNQKRGGLLDQQRDELLQKQAEGQPVDGELARNSNERRMTTGAGQLQSQWVEFTDSLGSGAENAGRAIPGSIGTSLDGVSRNSGLIMQTATWQRAMNQVVSGIVQDLVRLGLRTVAYYVLKSIWRSSDTA